MQRLLNFSSVALGIVAFLSLVWIIAPAPDYRVWLFSIAAGEWSLWLGALALLAVVCSMFSRLFYGAGKVWIVALIIGCSALLIAFYPLFSVLSLAREQNVKLSFSAYFNASKNVNDSAGALKSDFTTVVFGNFENQNLQMDVYAPTAITANNGAGIIVIHGGSWNAGARNDFPEWNRWLAAQGYTVFDVDYRLAPQPNYLTATGDVKCAVLQIKARAREFNIAPDRIALFGRSAGAHLALLAAYSAGDARLAATCMQPETNEQIRAVVSFYAPVDLLWSFDNPANRRVINGQATLAQFLGGSPHDSDERRERYMLASPDWHVTSNTPPTLLVHGGQDQLVRFENMQRLAERLAESGVSHKTLLIPYAQHGFDYNFNGWASQITKPAMLDFLSENTKPVRK